MKTAILEALKESETRTLSIKELRHKVIGKDKDAKKKFMDILDEMSLGKKIIVDGDNVTKLSKRGRLDEPVAPFEKGQRDEHGHLIKKANNSTNDNKSKYMPTVTPVENLKFDVNELWKNGEQVYR